MRIRTLLLCAPLAACVRPGYYGSGFGGGGGQAGPNSPGAAAPPPPPALATTGAAAQLTRVTFDDQSWEDSPEVSADGKWLLYTLAVPEYVDNQATGAWAARRIMRSRADGKSPMLLSKEWGQAYSPAWLPGGTSYVSVSDAMGAAAVMKALKVTPGAATTRILSEREVTDVAGVVVSPDGTRIAFHSTVGGQAMIGTARINGSELTHLVPGSFPSWSPDGTRLAFQREVDGRRQLFVTDAESGSELTQLTEGTDAAGDPVWSPDGSYLAFVSNRGWGRFPDGSADGSFNLFVVRPDGSGLVQLTEGNRWLFTPTWGSDGWIYFASNEAGSVDLWRIRPDLGALAQAGG